MAGGTCHPLRYLRATSAVLRAGIENDFRSTTFTDDERATLRRAHQLIERVEDDHWDEGMTPFEREHGYRASDARDVSTE